MRSAANPAQHVVPAPLPRIELHAAIGSEDDGRRTLRLRSRADDTHELPGTPLIHTRSLEEAVRVQSTINSPVTAEPTRGRTPFEWRASRVQLGDVAIVSSQYRAEVRGRAANIDQQFALLVPTRGRGESEHLGASAALVPGRSGAIVSPSAPAGFALGRGYGGIQVSIPQRMLQASFESLAGVSGHRLLRFDVATDLTRGGGAALLRMLELVLDGLDEAEARSGGSVLTTPAVGARLADALVHAVLVGLPHTGSSLLTAPRPSPGRALVRRAEEYLAANAHRAVSSAELAAALGVSARTVFAAFRAQRGTSPLAFHRMRRLELARRRLIDSPERSVTDVALACGFEHLGRFSVGYRARFGESPSETRLRAGGR